MKNIVLWALAVVLGLWFVLYVSAPGPGELRHLGTLAVPQVPGLRVVLEEGQEFEVSNGVYYRLIDPADRTLYGPFVLFGFMDWIDGTSDFHVTSYDSVVVITFDSPQEVVALYDVRAHTGYPGWSADTMETREDEYRRRDELLCRVQARNPRLRWRTL